MPSHASTAGALVTLSQHGVAVGVMGNLSSGVPVASFPVPVFAGLDLGADGSSSGAEEHELIKFMAISATKM